MRTLEEIVAEQQGSRASDDPVVAALMAELIRVAEELCVASDRLDTCLRLADGVIDSAAIDDYEVSPELTEERLARHKAFFEELFRRLTGASESQ